MNSVKELVKKSAELIDKGWDLLGNTNMSYCPVILVYLGETAHYNCDILLKTLKNNWKNGSYIEEILIPIDYDGTDAVMLENSAHDLGRGEVTGSVSEVIDACIRTRLLKSMNGVFVDKKRIFVEFISACEDIGSFEIINEILQPIDTLTGIEIWKSLYLMLDQSDMELDRKAKRLITHMNRENDKIFAPSGFRQIYIVSNYLCSGSILDENEIEANYRAVSDILLLKNNYNINTGTKGNEFELLNQAKTIRTFSYNLVEKPCREIAIATYMGLISEMVNVPVNDKIYSAFNTTEFTFFDDYYQQQIETKMPGAQAMEYMAWIPEELERLKKISTVNLDMLDRATMGQWSEFFRLYYNDVVKNETDNDTFKSSFHHYLKGKFNYKEMRECFAKDETKNVIERGSVSAISGVRDSVFIRAALFGKEYARELYYNSYVAPVYKDTLIHLYEQAESFERMIKSIDNYLPRTLVIINSRLYSSIGEYYGKIVKDYINDHRTEFNLLMDVDISPSEFYDKLFEFYKSLVNQISTYSLNFEQELGCRLEGMGNDFARRNQVIEVALNSNIEESRRLNVSMGANCRRIYQTYLGNPRADFVKRLMGDNINNVYDLEKSDCIENLVIYQLDSMSDIFGSAE